MSQHLLYPRPLARPSQYPLSILWTLVDCKDDAEVGMSASNRSCPPMHRSIRYSNGQIISESDWKSICEAAVHIARTHLVCLDSRVGVGQRRKKIFYKRQFPAKWDQALRELEKMAPLLSYCAGSWKADMVLGAVLQDERLSDPLPSPAASHRAASRSATPVTPSSRSAPRGSLRSHSGALSRASTPSGAPTSRTSQRPPSTGPISSASQQPPPPSARKAGSSKTKRKRAPSTEPCDEPRDEPHNAKKSKSTKDTVSSGAKTLILVSYSFVLIFLVGQRPRVNPRPAFLTFVASGANSVYKSG